MNCRNARHFWSHLVAKSIPYLVLAMLLLMLGSTASEAQDPNGVDADQQYQVYKPAPLRKLEPAAPLDAPNYIWLAPPSPGDQADDLRGAVATNMPAVRRRICKTPAGYCPVLNAIASPGRDCWCSSNGGSVAGIVALEIPGSYLGMIY